MIDSGKGVPLARVVHQLRQELAEAIKGGEGEEIKFIPTSIEIQLEVAITDTGGVTGTASFWVLTLGAEAKSESTHSHRITLTLTPFMDNDKMMIGSKDPGATFEDEDLE